MHYSLMGKMRLSLFLKTVICYLEVYFKAGLNVHSLPINSTRHLVLLHSSIKFHVECTQSYFAKFLDIEISNHDISNR